MKQKNTATLLALAVWLLLCSPCVDHMVSAQNSGGWVMVANKNNATVSRMNKSQASKLLLGETTTWPNGEKVVVVMGAAGSADRTAVLQKVCGMSEAEYMRHNLQASFMGEAPVRLYQATSAAAIKAVVRSRPGAVGFLRQSDVDGSVKAVWLVE